METAPLMRPAHHIVICNNKIEQNQWCSHNQCKGLENFEVNYMSSYLLLEAYFLFWILLSQVGQKWQGENKSSSSQQNKPHEDWTDYSRCLWTGERKTSVRHTPLMLNHVFEHTYIQMIAHFFITVIPVTYDPPFINIQGIHTDVNKDKYLTYKW